MTCHTVHLPNGVTAIVRMQKPRSRHCWTCKRLLKTWKLCDFPAGKGKTCDRVLCDACAVHREPDTDYCPQHAALTPEGRLKL